MAKVEAETQWLLDSQQKANPDRVARYSSILSALKVNNDERLQKLVLHFFNKGKYELQNFNVDFDNHELDIIDLLERWKDPENGIFNTSENGSDSRSHNSKRSSRTRNTSKTRGINSSRQNANNNTKDSEVRLNRERFEFDYWNEVAIGDDRQVVWKYTEKMMDKYFKVLQDRQTLVEHTGKLHMQNEELKTLLKQYLQANINLDLIVPPTDVIR